MGHDMDRINNCIKNSEGKITVETVIKGWQDGSGFAYETVIDAVEFAGADDYFKRAVPLEDWWEKGESPNPNYDDFLIQQNFYDGDSLMGTIEIWESELE